MYVGCRSNSRETKRENKFLTLRSPSYFAIFFGDWWSLSHFSSSFSSPRLPQSFFLFFCCTRKSLSLRLIHLFLFFQRHKPVLFFVSEVNSKFFFVALTNIVSCVMYARRLCRTVCYSASMWDMYFLLKELFRKVGQGKWNRSAFIE